MQKLFEELLVLIFDDIKDGSRWNNNKDDDLKNDLVEYVIGYANSADVDFFRGVEEFLSSDKISGRKKSHLDNIMYARARLVIRRAYMITNGRILRSPQEIAQVAVVEEQSMVSNPNFGRF